MEVSGRRDSNAAMGRGGVRDGGVSRYSAGNGEDVQEDEEETAERGG